MGQILSKYIRDGGNGYIMHWCPGCKEMHMFMVNSGQPGRDWTYNGNHEKPTFHPSMLINRSQEGRTCHYFLVDGMLQFCSDTDAHDIKGTVPLPELPQWMLEGEYAHSQADYEDNKFYEGLSAEDKKQLDAYMRDHWGSDHDYRASYSAMKRERDDWEDSTLQGV